MKIKRIMCIALALSMILATGIALGAAEYYSIRIVFHTSEREIPVTIDLYPEEKDILMNSSFLPDTWVRIPLSGMDEISAVTGKIRTIADDQTVATVQNCIQEWINYLQPETRTGVFSGDAFTEATEMRHIRFSYGDLVLLIRKIRGSFPEGSILRDLIDTTGIDGLLPEQNLVFDLKMFDDGKYVSLDLLKGEDTVLTCSGNIEDPADMLIVTGIGAESKNYYSRIIANMPDESRLILSEKLYADDLKTGFAGLNDNALIVSIIHEIDWTGKGETPENLEYTMILTPAKQEMPPISMNVSVTPSGADRIAEGEIRFIGYDQWSAVVTVNSINGTTWAPPAKLIDLGNAEDEAEFSQQMKTALIPLTLQVITALPEEYMMVLMNMSQ